VVDDHDLIAIEPVHLVSQEVSSLLVCIVSYDKSFAVLDEFQKLGCFGARRSAHIENRVIRLNVQQVRWEH